MSATLVSSIPLPFQETFFTSLLLLFQEHIFITPAGSCGIHETLIIPSNINIIFCDELSATNCLRRTGRDEFSCDELSGHPNNSTSSISRIMLHYCWSEY